MSLCINPNCSQPDNNSDTDERCQSCHSPLLLLDRYRVVRLLSDNTGFGTVYEADDRGTSKILKVLKVQAPKAIELFQQESQILSQFNHPGIPKIDCYFSITPTNGSKALHCLVMEKILGQNLQTWLDLNSPIDTATAIDWLRQTLAILDCVHQQNFFHRDLKPANIMLRPNGQLALIDFGTAREITQTYLAKMGGVSGITSIASAGYTPLEQNNGKAVPQSDFYALGRTWVYLLTGQHPTEFDEAEQGKLLWQEAVKEPFPPLLTLIDEMMSPFPAQRPKDTLEILERLDKLESLYKAYCEDPSILERLSAERTPEGGALESPRDRRYARDSASRPKAAIADAARADSPILPTVLHSRRARLWQVGGAAALAVVGMVTVGWWQTRSQPTAMTPAASLTLVLPETSSLPLPEAPPSPVAVVATPTPTPTSTLLSLEDEKKQVKLKVLSLRKKNNAVVLEISLQNKSGRPVKFLPNFIELTNEREQEVSAVPEGLPTELPASGKVVSGRLEIPKGLLADAEFLSLKLTNPDDEILLEVPKIPIAEFSDSKPPVPTPAAARPSPSPTPTPSVSPSGEPPVSPVEQSP
ncbi:serine/threonine-protein kinase [Oscillatoria sp. FACHB-1406]|uniref:serine/threonine protein kinase n=1 Tax=Oscillatoria sp. FACHB-1406 TaxID=2692846 RepID=UPI0016821D14|nr:serine/threonine-protein kinase [Oscillatoria sp. FACHB-1406]MBD2580030.1 serine/threonine protein kinase [Oscillatoria sp. FACHB-1406]